MRRPLVAGNWKLHKGPAEAAALVAELAAGLRTAPPACDVLVCPPFVSIPAAVAAAVGADIHVGAQTCANDEAGAHTGEVAAAMIRECGADHVLVGHSERRAEHRETDDDFVAKIERARAAGLVAVFCFGEELAQRRDGRAADVVRDQLAGVLPRLEAPDADGLVLAYEPVWAIGTGETATPQQAQEIHALAREAAAEILGDEVARRLRILYGGSVKPANAADIFGRPDIDGGLVGGASLAAGDFLAIIRGAAPDA